MTLPFVQSLLRDRFLHLLLIIACVLSAIVPFVPSSWPAAIDWHTIVTLSGLMLLTKGIELSGYFDVLGRSTIATEMLPGVIAMVNKKNASHAIRQPERTGLAEF